MGMQLKENFVISQVEDELLLVPVGADFHGLVRVKGAARSILEYLRTETDEAAMVERLLEEFEVPREKAERDVAKILAQLRDVDAIRE